MLAVIGYSNFDKGLGQVRIAPNESCQHDITTTCLFGHFYWHNKLSALPLFNLYTGISKIVEAILYSKPDKGKDSLTYVIEADFSHYRRLLVLTGIAELTLVGGWLLHGGMTVYYYTQEPMQPEEIKG